MERELFHTCDFDLSRCLERAHLTALPQPRQHLPKALQPHLKVLNNLFRQLVRLRQVVEIRQAPILEPEDVKTRLVARLKLSVAVAAPATFRRVFLMPGGYCRELIRCPRLEHIKCPVVHSGVQVNSWSANGRCEGN